MYFFEGNFVDITKSMNPNLVCLPFDLMLIVAKKSFVRIIMKTNNLTLNLVSYGVSLQSFLCQTDPA